MDYGTLRSLLYGEPSLRQWQRICALANAQVSSLPDGAERVAILDYAARALESWPSAWRVAPRAWLESVFNGGDDGERLGLFTHVLLGVRPFEQEWCWSFDDDRRFEEPIGPYDLEQLTTLVRNPHLKHITHLQLNTQYVEDELYAEIFAQPHLEQLEHLGLQDVLLTRQRAVELIGGLSRLRSWGVHAHTETLSELIRLGAFSGLEHLSLRDSAIEEPDLLANALTHERAPKLRALDLYDAYRGPTRDLLGILAQLPTLESVNLAGSELTPGCAEQLHHQPHLERWRHLDLSWSSALEDASLEAICQNEGLQQLEQLVLTLTQISDDGLSSLFAPGRFPKLRALDLSWCSIDNIAWPAEVLPSLQELRWGYSKARDVELLDFLREPGAARLRSFWWHNTSEPAQPFDVLFSMGESLPWLEALHIVECDVPAWRVKGWLERLNLPSLNHLDLRNTYLDTSSVEVILSRVDYFSQLRWLDLRYCMVNAHDHERLLGAPHLQRCVILTGHGELIAPFGVDE